MRAVSYAAYGAPPEVVDLPEPACPPDGVLVRVEATGVCRSDWHAWRGHEPVPLPMVPGHEYAGHLAAVGEEVAGWEVGDRVTVPFVLGCGQCRWCEHGEQQVCPDQQQPGFTRAGSWAELVAVPAAQANLVRLPDAVDAVTAASLGCRFATAYRAVRWRGRVQPGEWVVVHGCGGVGLSAVMVAAALGARVVGVDPSAEARALATTVGAEQVLDPNEADAVARVAELTDGGAAVSLDCLGHPAVAEASVRCLAPRGRHVQVGLLLGEHARSLPMDVVLARELDVLGSHGMPSGQYPELLAMLADGRLDPRRLVHRVVDLAEGPAALRAMDEAPAHAGLVVLTPAT